MQTGENSIIKARIPYHCNFLHSLNGESGRASHLVYKFDKQIARWNNSQIKILNLF